MASLVQPGVSSLGSDALVRELEYSDPPFLDVGPFCNLGAFWFVNWNNQIHLALILVAG